MAVTANVLGNTTLEKYYLNNINSVKWKHTQKVINTHTFSVTCRNKYSHIHNFYPCSVTTMQTPTVIGRLVLVLLSDKSSLLFQASSYMLNYSKASLFKKWQLKILYLSCDDGDQGIKQINQTFFSQCFMEKI